MVLSGLLVAMPMAAADTESAFSTFLDGPNMALAIIALIQLIAILSVGGIIKRFTQNTDYFVKLNQMRDS